MTDTDRGWLSEAIALARQGDALASPNPQVGAVVVDAKGSKAGEGTYTYEGRKHAEVLALEQAGDRARGATVYVSLEPCSIQGRTPPCVGALLEAGVSRVVSASRDRNPSIDGTGLDALRRAGVTVEEACGELADEAARINEAFFHFARTGRPLVTLKTALTLDGKIAAPDDNRGWITSETARQHVQHVRHRHDAIMTGIGTVLTDNCLLTDRTGLPRRRPLLRIVADSQLRLPLDSRLVKSFRDDAMVATSSVASDDRRKQLADLGIPVETFNLPPGQVDLERLVEWLGSQQILSLMVEGGALLNWSMLESGTADKVLLYYAPKILGGSRAVPMVGGPGRTSRAGAMRLRNVRTRIVAPDEFAVEAELVKDRPEAR